MESVFCYNKQINKDIKDILGKDEFMRISYVIRETNALNSERKGYILYIQASQDEIKNIEERFKELSLEVEKLKGHEEKTVIDSIKKEEENAASGMGTIFG